MKRRKVFKFRVIRARREQPRLTLEEAQGVERFLQSAYLARDWVKVDLGVTMLTGLITEALRRVN